MRLGFGALPRWHLIGGGVGRADDSERVGTRGSIRWWRRSCTTTAFHGGAAPLSLGGRKAMQKGEKKEEVALTSWHRAS
jgi:hypothetical protein